MVELFNELFDKWIIIYAIIAVGFTEAIMRWTSDKVTRWKYAIPITFLIAITLAMLHGFEQGTIWQHGLSRGFKSFMVGIAGYDIIKSFIAHLPSRLTDVFGTKNSE